MRWQTKLKIVGFVTVLGIPGIIGAGIVKDLALAARARESTQVVQVVAEPVRPAPVLSKSLLVRQEQPQLPVGVSMSDFLCLLKLVHGEAGAESAAGQAGVAFVALNRRDLKPKEFGKTLCDVAYQLIPRKHKRPGKQFDGVYTPVYDFRDMTPVAQIVIDVLSGKLKPQGDMRFALYFYNPKTSGPNGAWHANNTVRVVDGAPEGKHVFGMEKYEPQAAKVQQQVIKIAKR